MTTQTTTKCNNNINTTTFLPTARMVRRHFGSSVGCFAVRRVETRHGLNLSGISNKCYQRSKFYVTECERAFLGMSDKHSRRMDGEWNARKNQYEADVEREKRPRCRWRFPCRQLEHGFGCQPFVRTENRSFLGWATNWGLTGIWVYI